MNYSAKQNMILNRVRSFKPHFAIVSLMLILSLVSTAMTQKESDVFPVPESYKVEGIPEIKNSEVEQLYYDPKSIRSNLIWDADHNRRRLLVTDETNNVYLLDSPLSKPSKLIEKAVPYKVIFNPKKELLAYMDDQEDKDNFQLYLYDFKNGKTTKLTTLTGKDESVGSFIWNENGGALFYTKVDYDTKTSKLCENDLQKEKCFQVELKGIWDVLDSHKNKFLLKYWKASSSQNLYLYDARTKNLTPIDEKGNSRRGFFVRDKVFWTSEGNENCKSEPCILSFNLKNKSINQLKLPTNLSNLNDVKVSPKDKNLLIQETKDGIDHLRIFRIKKNKLSEISPFLSESYVVWNTRWLSDNEVVYTIENIGKPASVQSFDIKSKRITNWTKENLPDQLQDKVIAPKIIRWKSFDQLEISGYIVRPKVTQKKSPVLIYIHGGPQILDKPVFNSQDIILASNLGLTIIHTNIRGSSGFGKDFMDADNKEKRGNAVKDIRGLIDWVEKQPDLDPDQIFLRGESYGGFIALSTALNEADKIKGVIAEYPLISIRSYLSQSWIDEFAKSEYGNPKDENLMSMLDKLSPLNNTEKWNKIPLFLTRGKLDERSFEKDVIDLKTQLQNKDSEVWFIYSKEAGHGFGGKYVTAAMYKFLQKQINKELNK